MSSVEQTQLRPVERLIHRAVGELGMPDLLDSRLQLLEAVSGAAGGWNVDEYAKAFGIPAPQVDFGAWVEKLHAEIHGVGIPLPLALASLAREPLQKGQRRSTGAYYTDWRLAELLAGDSVRDLPTGLWVDPACGTGILLAAAVMASGEKADERTRVIRECLCGADLSANALRGARLAVASLTDDLHAIEQFNERLVLQDSLRSAAAWKSLAPDGFSLVIANPPWEKLKATRHEVTSSAGTERHYGKRFSGDEGVADARDQRLQLMDYVSDVVTGTRLQGRGEHDLYKLFLELGFGLARDGGVLGMLVPAGLIRSQGTEDLRRELFSVAHSLEIGVIENRRRHFDIDTRFKFLTVVARVGEQRKTPLRLRVADRTGHLSTTAVRIPRTALSAVRPDLSVPEVRTDEEWRLFARLSETGVLVGNPRGPWAPQFLREVDMTNDAGSFVKTPRPGDLPLVEGRQVHQFRSAAKRYVSGDGRAAIWERLSLNDGRMLPQWFMPQAALRAGVAAASKRNRIGFCDITGQTNERTLLAARVPAGVVCGNKVPTITFSSGTADQEDLFLALVNSITVDWMLRRMVTTTLNFFLFESLPLPPISAESAEGAELIRLSRLVTDAEGSEDADLWVVGSARARMDALIAKAWGLSETDLDTVLTDFPLLDRGQPTLKGESISTVTKDLIGAAYAHLTGSRDGRFLDRLNAAKQLGATAFIPAGQLSKQEEE